MIKWEDSTPYSRNDKERIPSCWDAHIGGVRISVLNSHIYYQGKWIMHCYPWFDTFELNVNTEQEAKTRAVAIVYKKIKNIYNAFSEAGADE
jgi:hypothetical protein